MQSITEVEVFSLRALTILEYAERLVRMLPGDVPLRCHEVARIVKRSLDSEGRVMQVVDGCYGYVEHSWLLLHGEGWGPFILDPYAVGRLPQVQLVDPVVPGAVHLYTVCRPRSDIDRDLVEALVREVRGHDRWNLDVLPGLQS